MIKELPVTCSAKGHVPLTGLNSTNVESRANATLLPHLTILTYPCHIAHSAKYPMPLISPLEGWLIAADFAMKTCSLRICDQQLTNSPSRPEYRAGSNNYCKLDLPTLPATSSPNLPARA